MQIRTEVRLVRPTTWYVVLAYTFSWAWWIPLAVSGTVVEPGQGWPSHLPGLLGPALAAIAVTAFTRGREGLRELGSRILRWRVGWVWYVLIAGTAALALLPLVVGDRPPAADFAAYSGAPAAGIVAVVLLVLLVNGFGEEIGWRGFLADNVLKDNSPMRTSVIVWAIWAGWHAPLFWVVGNFRDLGAVGIIGWSIGLLAGSVWLTWLYRSAERSILIVALWHTAYNFTSATRASAGVAAAVSSTLVMVAAVVIWWRSRQARRSGAVAID